MNKFNRGCSTFCQNYVMHPLFFLKNACAAFFRII